MSETISTRPLPAEVWPVATFLTEEMEARHWSPDTVAEHCGLPFSRVMAILEGQPLTDDDAERLGIGFGTSPDYWRNLDAAYWSALARELGPGGRDGRILSAEDVAALRTVLAQLDDPVGSSGLVGDADPQEMYTFWAIRDDVDRLRALLGAVAGEGAT